VKWEEAIFLMMPSLNWIVALRGVTSTTLPAPHSTAPEWFTTLPRLIIIFSPFLTELTTTTSQCNARYRKVIPIPNQGAIFVGSSSAPQRTVLYAFVASILTALISSLI
jgi:hypothetical protein